MNKTKNTKIIAISIIAAFSFIYAQSNYPYPEDVSPEVYKVIYENEEVKMLEATFKPGQSDKFHQHRKAYHYFIEGGKLQLTWPDGSVVYPEPASGAPGHSPAGSSAHKVKNIGENTVRLVIVEFKNVKQKK
ncbi:MAG: hypothetical protein U9N31_03895 [Candidatus Marinimicrobia bacterium]|mgnify:CR=1 FL=1|nr:hypothetical protein [Candidatus Neomarinimicrobiota bacterium]